MSTFQVVAGVLLVGLIIWTIAEALGPNVVLRRQRRFLRDNEDG